VSQSWTNFGNFGKSGDLWYWFLVKITKNGLKTIKNLFKTWFTTFVRCSDAPQNDVLLITNSITIKNDNFILFIICFHFFLDFQISDPQNLAVHILCANFRICDEEFCLWISVFYCIITNSTSKNCQFLQILLQFFFF